MTDKDEPNRDKPLIDKEDPILTKLLNEIDEPKDKKSKIDTEDPKRSHPYKDS